MGDRHNRKPMLLAYSHVDLLKPIQADMSSGRATEITPIL